jgi:hypothetical protein
LKDNGSVERTEEKRKVYFTRLAWEDGGYMPPPKSF